MSRMSFPNPDILLYIAMADAYAAATEYIKMPRDQKVFDQAVSLRGYVAHPTHGHAAGLYTDDAEMSIGNVKVLLVQDDHTLNTMQDFAQSWVEEFVHGGMRKGYSRGFQSVLEGIVAEDRDPGSFGSRLLLALSGHEGSNKNGAAMRSMVFGVMPMPDEAMVIADAQARITHDSPEGRFSARIVALMAHYALYETAPLSKLPDYCQAHLSKSDIASFGHIIHSAWSGGSVSAKGEWPVSITTVHAAFHLVTRERSLLDMLTTCMRWGGDTDSVAAIAWGIASARHQNEVLPAFFERDLEQGSPRTGSARLKALGQALMAKFDR